MHLSAATLWIGGLLSLALLPMFIVPARRVGKKLAAITREGMDLNAGMNTQMTERFNVSGAMLVKLFGRPDRERDEFASRADRVRRIGVRSAMYSRTFVIALTLVGALGTAAVYWIGGHLVVSGSISDGTLVALSLLVARIYTPLTSLTNARVDVMSALVSNVCGSSFWPGTLCTLVPAGTTALAGEPSAVSTPKARYALAATPGQEVTYTAAPPGSGLRMALDRDLDGELDGGGALLPPAGPQEANADPAGCGCGAAGGGDALLAGWLAAVLLRRGRSRP